MTLRIAFLVLLALAVPASPESYRGAGLEGTWRAQLGEDTCTVIVPPDSSASMGAQALRWRVEADSLLMAMGDAWQPLILFRAGPASPRRESVPPPAPPRRARPNR